MLTGLAGGHIYIVLTYFLVFLVARCHNSKGKEIAENETDFNYR